MDNFKEREDVDPFFYDPEAELDYLLRQREIEEDVLYELYKKEKEDE